MSSIINEEDKIWKLFLGYESLVGAIGKDVGLNFYGSDQKTALAKDLVIAHMLDHVACVLKDIKEQTDAIERTRHHLRPQTVIQAQDLPPEE